MVLPGLCVASYLRPMCDALAAEDFGVWLVEPPGWPRSDRPVPEPAKMADLAGWVVSWLDSMGLTDIVLIGQSMGAQLAGHVAAQVPDRFKLLVLQGPVFDPAYRSTVQALGRCLMDTPREKVSLAARELPEWLRVGPRRISRNLRLSLNDAVDDTLGTVRCPVLVVVGEHDTLAGRAWAAQLATPDAGLVVMPGLPHSAANKDPAGCARLIRDHGDR